MSDPAKLDVVRNNINDHLVRMLEFALERAKTGKATGFSLVVLEPGHWYWVESSFDHRLEFIGALEIAKKDALEVNE